MKPSQLYQEQVETGGGCDVLPRRSAQDRADEVRRRILLYLAGGGKLAHRGFMLHGCACAVGALAISLGHTLEEAQRRYAVVGSMRTIAFDMVSPLLSNEEARYLERGYESESFFPPADDLASPFYVLGRELAAEYAPRRG